MSRAPEGTGFALHGRQRPADEQPVDPSDLQPGQLVVTRFANCSRQVALVVAVSRARDGHARFIRCFKFRAASSSWTTSAIRVTPADVLGLYVGAAHVIQRLVAQLEDGSEALACWRKHHPESEAADV